MAGLGFWAVGIFLRPGTDHDPLGGCMKRPQKNSTETRTIDAPIGGINTVDAGRAMPPTDCIWAWNMVAAEYGLRTRLGFREWALPVSDIDGNAGQVRTLLPFTGSAKSGAANKLFAVTSRGIWNVSDSAVNPSIALDFLSYAWASGAGDAGYGTSCAFSTPAGRFLLYCDEVNGLFVYTESTATWLPVVVDTNVAWLPLTTYVSGNKVTNGGGIYRCTTGGVSANSSGPSGLGTGIADGTVVWAWDSDPVVGGRTIGPSIADQILGYTADPRNFVFVTAWKNRVWLVERDTDRAYYLDTNAVYGEATSFAFGAKFRAGGPLRCLSNWSYDGGSGLDTSLVAVSGGGDVSIYSGTDPAFADTFGNKGCWSVGAVPNGRNITTQHGGDLLIASAMGVAQMSKLVLSNSLEDRGIYATGKIGNLFAQLASSRRTLSGWALHIHPTDNALMVLVPSEAGVNTEQLVMSFTTKGWTRYRDLPMLSACVWAGDLYFGTSDGRVCRNIDYVDEVPLDNSTSTPVKYSCLSAYNNLGNMRQKQVQLIRPVILSGEDSPVVQVSALYDYDLVEPENPTGSPSGGWDSGVWDDELWGGDYYPAQILDGGAGMGRDVAIAIRGSASSRIVLVGFDVTFTQGGIL